jgi:two-component system, OmpR family, sensor kinase
VLAGTSTGERDESLQTLSELLAIGGATALVLASLAGYAVASGALRPVEAMRRRAATISRADPDQRLPVARSGDEIARLGSTLNDMLDRLSEAFARERRFVADASHELRTPLTILRAEVELALRDGRSPQELRRALESVGEESDRLVRLAEDLLVLARLDRGRLPVRAEPCDAEELLQAVAARFRERARRQGAMVRVSGPPGLVVLADRLRLEQALGNLIDNALRHAAHEVRVAAVDGPLVELHVIDDGDGFEPDLIERAFGRFVRGRREPSGGGAGLGLAIVAAIAESHGGRVRAANLPAGGADVWIELRADVPAPRVAELSTAG